MAKALLLVDIQNDFSPRGALPVPDGDAVVPVINQLIPLFEHVIATKDWHPAQHASFASVQGKAPGEVIDLNGIPQVMWPEHCIQNTQGAEFIDGLEVQQITHTVLKGTHPDVDSYSGFFDNQRFHATGLAEYLSSHGISDVYIAGLATDYCVKFTALDAISLCFNTWVIQDACRGVELNVGDCATAWHEMQTAGCQLINAQQLLVG
ncbi:bifunctional nicotinamidase/pyrazinamidase [Vibrio metoecus]|uniref:bifunctional nicotinamidase/pyrazinamidase n=1 Tax=Vibrio metoecus TaxID=1481663 RepID=UPI0006D85561|nr:bifunctional nicotinamidase/pyrazinamidase [Vibrio metoecus]KQA16734.1 isochorismatase [Vibrio metoecus]